MGHKTIFLKETYQRFQIRHPKKNLVTFSTTLNSQKVYLPKHFTHYCLKANIVLYNTVQNLRGLFFCSLTILNLVIYVKVVYTNKE